MQVPEALRSEWTMMGSYFWVTMQTWTMRRNSFGGKTTQSPLIPVELMKEPKQMGTVARVQRALGLSL